MAGTMSNCGRKTAGTPCMEGCFLFSGAWTGQSQAESMWTDGAGGGSLGHSLFVAFLDVINATSFPQGAGREKAMGF